MPVGQCKLCLLTKDLRNSHLMPRSLYKNSRGAGTKGNQDPVLITKTSSKKSSYQITDYVLCGDCEQLFSKNGEGYVMPLATQLNGKFPLWELLKATKPSVRGHGYDAYSCLDTPNVDRDKIAYFAISVFWRASVHTWEQENGDSVRIDLGRKYNEEVRKYLHEESGVPKNASLQVTVCSDELNQKSFFAPHENQKHKDRTFIFVARGMTFFFRISNILRGFEERLSIVNNPQRWISVRDCGDRPIWR
jgi:hypothetical protein